MATAASSLSLDPPSSLIDLPPLANPHPPHPKVPEPGPVPHPHVRRVSSDSQAPGRASPAPRISRRTPVPFLLEAFPAPPSHIPGTPTTVTPNALLNSPSLLASAANWLTTASAGAAATTNVISTSNPNATSPTSSQPVLALVPHNNPPPSLPPTGPLPPVPGPSSVTPDLITAHCALQTVARSASPAVSLTESQRSQSRTEQRPRLSIDVNQPLRGRGRQGSLSSLRNPIYPVSEYKEPITEEPANETSVPPPPSSALPPPPLFGSVAERKSHDQSRGDSPDILRSNRAAGTSFVGPDNKPYVEDSIAGVDMSDLSALKSDNEGEGDDQASRPFPRFPPLPRSQPQSPAESLPSAASQVPAVRKLRKSSIRSLQVTAGSEDVNTRHRAVSPEVTQMITATPRPRKHSMASRSRDPSRTRHRKESRRSGDVPPLPASARTVTATLATKTTHRSDDDGTVCVAGEGEGNESDSSLDLHTPLPQLMLRHGMLSPSSKLLPRGEADSTRLSIMSSFSASSHLSNASNTSLMSAMSTCSKHAKDARDTPQRRNRHRDGRLLKGGVGLTTGLGWSDSEDEDAPSPLTRRVSTLVLSRRASSSSVASYRSAPSQHPLARSISHSVLREADEHEPVHDTDEFGLSHRSSIATKSLPSRSKPLSRVGSVRSTGSSLGRYSTYSASSTGHRARAGSMSESIRPVNDALMPGIREHDDGITPTRAAFERSSVGSLNGGSGADPHTPSSTASSASLSFPATPESSEEIPPLQPLYNQDKMLPPLPLAAKGKHPSVLGLRSQSGRLQRPRTYSNASSASNNSMLVAPSADSKVRSLSPTSTPRPSLVERPPNTSLPAGLPRPSLNGTPRPSLTIPKSPLLPHSSALPRPTTPSLSPVAPAGQAYTPRPLRLVSRSSSLPSSSSPANPSHPLPDQTEPNQTASKSLQPGERSPRPGQVLTYNRNVHDQLKLRALSLNTGSNHTSGSAASPGGTQTLFIPSPGASAGPNSALSTPITALSQSPLPSPNTGGESPRPKPRTGTGMMYRNNLTVGSVTTSRIRAPSAIPQ